MNKKSNSLIVIIVIIIFIIVAYLIYTYGPGDSDKGNNIAVNNTTQNTSVENKTNNVTENKAEPEKTNNEENKVEDNPNSELTSEDEKEIAMNIAKEAWGDTDGVYFQMEGTQKANGDYIISVSADAKVLAWYYVNASQGTYTVEYN